MSRRFPTFPDQPVACPFCGSPNDALTGISGPDAPTDGAVIICIDCIAPGILEDGHIRRPTDDETAAFTQLPEYQAAIAALVATSRRPRVTKYAADTSVPSDRSRAEIERTLARYGAQQFMYGWDQDSAIVGFVAGGRQVRFVLPLPDRNDRDFTHTPSRGTRRSDAQIEAAYEQAVRQRWRALALVIKAKLEAVEAGIVTFDEEFGMHFMLPNGQTVGEWISPQIDKVYEHGIGMLELMPGSSS